MKIRYSNNGKEEYVPEKPQQAAHQAIVAWSASVCPIV